MFEHLRDFFGGKSIYEKDVEIGFGKLKIILKQRISKRYLYMKFSYPGNTQYHALTKEDVDNVITALTKFRNDM